MKNDDYVWIKFRPPVDTIDFFNDTLDIRKDAIQPYKNYNDEELDSISVNLGISKENVLQVLSPI